MAIDIERAFAAWRTKHARRAWKPVCGKRGAGGARFGGSTELAPGERWPTCKTCSWPMRLLLQLPLASLPAGFARRGEGVLQLFYCSQDDGGCETWRPFSGTQLARLVAGPLVAALPPTGLTAFPARGIERWDELVDYPDPEEHGSLGLVCDYDFANKRASMSCKELGFALRDVDLDVAESISFAEAGDKLGGWPHWVQGVEYPDCPRCSRRMELVLQLDSEDNLPYMFGDAGCGHITQCADHPDVLAFGWACC